MPIRDFIVLAFFIGSLPICLFRPFYGIILWTVLAFLNPHRFAWGPAQDVPLALLVGVATLAGFLLFSRNWKNLFCREVFLLELLWMWFTLTTVASTHTPLLSANAETIWFRWEFVSKIMLMTTVTVGLVTTWSRFRWLLLAIGGSFGLLVMKTLPFLITTGGEYRLYGPDDSMISDNNDFALAINMALPIFIILSTTEADRRLRWLFGFLFVAAIPTIFFTYSRGGMVGLAAIILLLILRMKKRMLLIPVLAITAVIAIFFAPEQWKQRMDFSSSEIVDASAEARMNAWRYSWRLASDHPFTGGGFDAYTPQLYSFYAPDPSEARAFHSIYFGVLAEHGFVGLGLYLALVAYWFISLWWLARSASRSGDSRTALCATMLQVSLAGFLASGVFLGRQYFDFYFMIVACLAILRRLWLEQCVSQLADQHARMPEPALHRMEPERVW